MAVFSSYSYGFFIIAAIIACFSSLLVAFITLLWFKNAKTPDDDENCGENGKVY
jgi:hypothetical protein